MSEHPHEENKTLLIELTADIVAAYVSNNAVVAADLPTLINNVHNALGGVALGEKAE